MGMQMNLSYVFAVVITGLVVVFLGLVLLIAFISLIGWLFKTMDKNKKAAKPADIPVPKAAAPAAVKQVQSADDDEVIAVISAAVAMMSAADGTSYRIKSVKAASNGVPARNAWASAGLRESTNPF
ncbi:MAG: OadG family protein [Oscillospiraceae bacterium]|nr:OadG family protein [Oscillospiraceae bacterium]